MKTCEYTFDMIEWLKDNSWGKTNKQITIEFNLHFGVSYSFNSIAYIRDKYKISNGIKANCNVWDRSRKRKYTPAMEEWLKSNSHHKFQYEITEEFNNFFHVNYSSSSIATKRKEIKAYSNVMESHRAIRGTDKTWFKKGSTPHNTRPVGSEVFKKEDNQIWVKVAQPNVWKAKSRLIWEEAYGPIPKDSVIVVLNQNPHDLRIENLMCIKKAEASLLNIRGQRTGDTELTKANILINRLQLKVNKEKKEK